MNEVDLCVPKWSNWKTHIKGSDRSLIYSQTALSSFYCVPFIYPLKVYIYLSRFAFCEICFLLLRFSCFVFKFCISFIAFLRGVVLKHCQCLVF